jgi:(p)ppGpp synthase/HD superfamily hydrolase
MTRIQQAIDFATERHKTQRLNNRPYIAHPLLVCDIVQEVKPEDEDSHIAALLHDTVEDTASTLVGKAILLTQIEIKFGARVAEMVRELTDNDAVKKEMGKVAHLIKRCTEMSSDSLTIKLADRLAHTKNIFEMSFEDTFANALVTRQALDSVMPHRELDEPQTELIRRFNTSFDKLTLQQKDVIIR